jgi:hypothetical protein
MGASNAATALFLLMLEIFTGPHDTKYTFFVPARLLGASTVSLCPARIFSRIQALAKLFHSLQDLARRLLVTLRTRIASRPGEACRRYGGIS